MYQDEIGCDGKSINSHDIPSSVIFYCEELDRYFSLERIEANTLGGCGCWSGIELVIKPDNDE